MQKSNPKKIQKRPQSQDRPGDEGKMKPRPEFRSMDSRGSGKMLGKKLLITVVTAV